MGFSRSPNFVFGCLEEWAKREWYTQINNWSCSKSFERWEEAPGMHCLCVCEVN